MKHNTQRTRLGLLGLLAAVLLALVLAACGNEVTPVADPAPVATTAAAPAPTLPPGGGQAVVTTAAPASTKAAATTPIKTVGVTPIAPQATPVKPAPTAFTRQIRHGCQNHSLTSWISMPKNTGTYVTKNSCIAVLGGDFSTGFTPLDPIEDHPAYFVSNPGTINPGEATLKLYIGGDNDD